MDLVRRGELKPDDLVWEPSFGAVWRAAGAVDGLVDKAADATAKIPSLPEYYACHAADEPRTPLIGVAGTRPHFGAATREAWGVMKQMLFKPLDLARWFSMGFCAWLAAIGSGGCSASIPDKNMFTSFKNNPNPNADVGAMINNIQAQYHTFMDAHPEVAAAIMAIIFVVIAASIAWMLVATWLRSRGAFMLVHRWHRPDDTVSQSWAAGRGLGRSLFLWRVIFGCLMSILLIGLTGALVITVVLPFVRAHTLAPGGLFWILGLSCGLLLVVSCWGTVNLMLDAFVVPVMYWRRVGVLDAWRVVLAFCNEQPAAVLIFLTVWPLLILVGILAVMAVILCTCCIVCIPLMLPYVNQVVMLPLTIFLRGVGIRFLKQWRPDL